MRGLPALTGLLLLAGCGGASAPSTPAPDAGVLLRLDPPVGQISTYKMVSETSMEMEGMPMMGGGASFAQTLFITQEVVAEEEDRKTIAYTIDSVDVEAPGMMASVGQILNQAEGMSARMVVTTRGEFESAEVDQETLPAGMESAFEAMKEGMKGLSMGFPEDLATPGETWTVPMENSVPLAGMGEMNQTGEMIFTFDQTDARADGVHAILSFVGTMDQNMGADPSAAVSFGMDATGESTGSVDVNLDEGRVVSMTMVMNMTGVMSMMGNDIPLTSTVTMTQTLVNR